MQSWYASLLTYFENALVFEGEIYVFTILAGFCLVFRFLTNLGAERQSQKFVGLSYKRSYSLTLYNVHIMYYVNLDGHSAFNLLLGSFSIIRVHALLHNFQ